MKLIGPCLASLFAFLALAPSAVAQGPEITIEQPVGVPLANGVVIGWGYDGDDRTIPPAGLVGVKAIAAGGRHSVALKGDGTVVAWGTNDLTQADVPVGLTGVEAIAAGDSHTVALKGDGTVVAWGWPTSGQTTVPQGLTGVTAVTAAGDYTMALKSDGTVVAWGWYPLSPATVPAGLTEVVAIAAAVPYTAALKEDGTVVTWGDYPYRTVPAGLSGVTAIASGWGHTVALKTDGTVVAWGLNEDGQTDVPEGLTGVKAIAAGSFRAVAVKSDGTIVSWGEDYFGQLAAPAKLMTVRSIVGGGDHVLALTDSTVDFGDQIVGTPSAQKTFTIRNTGAGPLEIAGLGQGFEFTVNTHGMATTLPANTGETTFTVTFTPSAPGLRQAILQVESNDSDEGSYDIVLTCTGVAAPPLETWRQLHFGTTANAGNAADDADANDNGIANLLEYALGGDPKGHTTGLGILPRISHDGEGRQQFVFSYYASRNDITLTIQASDDLDRWEDLARRVNGGTAATGIGGVLVSEMIAGPVRTLTVRDRYWMTDPAHPKRFMRLQVTRP